jgi:hypothetical protein
MAEETKSIDQNEKKKDRAEELKDQQLDDSAGGMKEIHTYEVARPRS